MIKKLFFGNIFSLILLVNCIDGYNSQPLSPPIFMDQISIFFNAPNDSILVFDSSGSVEGNFDFLSDTLFLAFEKAKRNRQYTLPSSIVLLERDSAFLEYESYNIGLNIYYPEDGSLLMTNGIDTLTGPYYNSKYSWRFDITNGVFLIMTSVNDSSSTQELILEKSLRNSIESLKDNEKSYIKKISIRYETWQPD